MQARRAARELALILFSQFEKEITKYFIDVTIDDGQKWRLTGMYGEPSWD